MATVYIPRPSTAPPLLPVHTHNASLIRNEQPIPLGTMSDLSNGRYEQLPRAEPSYNSNEGSSTKSETTLTPTSDNEQAQGSGEAPSNRFVAPEGSHFLASLPHFPPFRRTTATSLNVEEKITEERVRYEKLEDFPEGLPRLAALLDSNESFTLFRRFGTTAARILLHREIELGILIEQLHKVDKDDAAPGGKLYRLRSVEHNELWDATKEEMRDKIDTKLFEYHERLLKYFELSAYVQATERDQASVGNWIRNNSPLDGGEDDFILYIEDLVSVKKRREGTNQNNRLEDLLDSWAPAFLNKYLQAKNERKKTDNPFIRYRSNEKLATLARIVIVFLAVNFLLIPVFILFLVQMTRSSMTLVVLAFVLAFAMVLGGPVQAKPQEILIGTSAYGAFLVTFLGHVNSGYAVGAGPQ